MPEKKRLGRPRRTDLRRVMEAYPVDCYDRLPMAPITPELPSLHDRAGLFLPLDPRGTMGSHKPYSRDPVAGKKIKGRKRHIVTDTLGHIMTAVIQDRDGALMVAARIRSLFPWLRHLIADGGYAGEKLRNGVAQIGQ